MKHDEINELKRIFISRLDALSHILDVGEHHIGDERVMLDARLAPDMWPLRRQVAAVCNSPRGFSQWCAGDPVENLGDEVNTLEQARAIIADTKARVTAIAVDDSQLDIIKRVGLGPGLHCELPGRQYVNDYLMPNLYFHITTAYAIMRAAGAPLAKSDFMSWLAPLVQKNAQ